MAPGPTRQRTERSTGTFRPPSLPPTLLLTHPLPPSLPPSLPHLKEALCTFPGVGRKVADCVALFSLDQFGAIPVDVHVGREGGREGWEDIIVVDCVALFSLDQFGAIVRREGGREGERGGWVALLSWDQYGAVPVDVHVRREGGREEGGEAEDVCRNYRCFTLPSLPPSLPPLGLAHRLSRLLSFPQGQQEPHSLHLRTFRQQPPTPPALSPSLLPSQVWRIACRDYSPSLKGSKSLTPAIYESVGDIFREKFGSHAGWYVLPSLPFCIPFFLNCMD